MRTTSQRHVFEVLYTTHDLRGASSLQATITLSPSFSSASHRTQASGTSLLTQRAGSHRPVSVLRVRDLRDFYSRTQRLLVGSSLMDKASWHVEKTTGDNELRLLRYKS
jgi:hypothetical protein